MNDLTVIPWQITVKEFTSLPDPILSTIVPFGLSPNEYHRITVKDALEGGESVPYKVVWDYEELLTRQVLTDMAIELGLINCEQCGLKTTKKIYKDKLVDWCETHGNVTGFTSIDPDIDLLSDEDLKKYIYNIVFEVVDLKNMDITLQKSGELTYEEQRKKELRSQAAKKRVAYGQQSLTSAVSTSRRLIEFENTDNIDLDEQIESIKDILNKLALQEGD